MNEEVENGNFITKTEALISSCKDTIIVLKSRENLSPWAENSKLSEDAVTR
jgi:hypothetical protein